MSIRYKKILCFGHLHQPEMDVRPFLTDRSDQEFSPSKFLRNVKRTVLAVFQNEKSVKRRIFLPTETIQRSTQRIYHKIIPDKRVFKGFNPFKEWRSVKQDGFFPAQFRRRA